MTTDISVTFTFPDTLSISDVVSMVTKNLDSKITAKVSGFPVKFVTRGDLYEEEKELTEVVDTTSVPPQVNQVFLHHNIYISRLPTTPQKSDGSVRFFHDELSHPIMKLTIISEGKRRVAGLTFKLKEVIGSGRGVLVIYQRDGLKNWHYIMDDEIRSNVYDHTGCFIDNDLINTTFGIGETFLKDILEQTCRYNLCLDFDDKLY